MPPRRLCKGHITINLKDELPAQVTGTDTYWIFYCCKDERVKIEMMRRWVKIFFFFQHSFLQRKSKGVGVGVGVWGEWETRQETLCGRYCTEYWPRTAAEHRHSQEGRVAHSGIPSCHPDFPTPDEMAEQVMLSEVTVPPWPSASLSSQVNERSHWHESSHSMKQILYNPTIRIVWDPVINT